MQANIFYLRWCGLFLCSFATSLSYLGGWFIFAMMVDDRESNISRAEVFSFDFLLSGLSEYNLVLHCPYRLVGCFESWCVLFALLRRLCPATRNYSTND